MASSKRRILFVIPSYGATAWYRANVPGKELARRGHTVNIDVSAELNSVQAFDLMVISNGATQAGIQAVDYAKSMGKTVIADIDDDPWHMDEWNPNMARWDDSERTCVETILSMADCVTTTNKFLADFVGQFSKNVVILPNCLPGEYWDVPKSQHSGAVLGWIGGHTHYNDLQMVSEPVNSLLAAHTDLRMQMTVFGENPFEPKKRVTVLPHTMDLTAYPNLFSELDLGIAPLVGTHFNRAKSDLKFLEYGAARVPCVATNLPTYSETVRHGENGFLAAGPEDWTEHMTALVEDKALRERIGAEARETAESRFIDKNIELWEKAYGL